MSNPRSAASQSFKKAAGLDDIEKSFDLSSDDVEDEGARDTASPASGSHTKALAEQRAAEAKMRREEAVRRANERSANFKGFDQPEAEAAPKTSDAASTAEAPVAGDAERDKA